MTKSLALHKLRTTFLGLGLLLSFFCCLSFSLKGSSGADKLAKLYQLPWGTHIKYLDLSGQNLTEVPILSMYDIESLNLSHNNIRSINMRNLPIALKKLNVSYNHLADTIVWNELYAPDLRVLNLSHNRITAFIPLFRNMDLLDLSYNDLVHYIEHNMPLKCEKSRILVANISYNPRLSPIVLRVYSWMPLQTLRIIRKGTPAEHKRLDYNQRRGEEIGLKYNLYNHLDYFE